MPQLDFHYSQQELKQLAENIIDIAHKEGATSAQVEVIESIDTGVEILAGNIENFENSRENVMTLSVYVGRHRGNVGISQVPPHDITAIVKRAIDIAKYTEEDEAHGIPDKELLCESFTDTLELYNPVEIANEELIANAKDLENFTLNYDSQITNSEGASISLTKYNFVIANSHGLNLGYKTTRYSKSISVIGKIGDNMQTDYWYSSSRNFDDLASNPELAITCANRLIRRLTRGSIPSSGAMSVIFEAPIAKSLIGACLSALSGSSLYRGLSFLKDSLGKQIFPEWLTINENPLVKRGLSSSYFDDEGVIVQERDIISQGHVNGYLLNNYTATKLGLKSTGNAGGYHNITVTNNFSGDLIELAQELGQGLIIIETIGQGVNLVNGNYSVGGSGLWVEKGAIQFFVDNLTISGNLQDIFKNILYVSDDYAGGSINCGSILVENITVSS